MDRCVRFAAIGCGGIFRGAHMSAYVELPEARLVAFYDVDLKKAEEALALYRKCLEVRAKEARGGGDEEKAKEFEGKAADLKVYGDLEKLLTSGDVEAVDVCTPPRWHGEIAVKALERGVNVMVEKPMCRTWLEAMDVVEAAEKSKALFQYNENWVFAPSCYTMRKLITAGDIGEVQRVVAQAIHGGPEGVGWFWEPSISGGGGLIDCGVHAIGASWYLIGLDKKPLKARSVEPRGICVRRRQRMVEGLLTNIKVEDDGHIEILFEDKEKGGWSTAYVEGGWSDPEITLHPVVNGTDGDMTIVSAAGQEKISVKKHLYGERLIDIPKGDSFHNEIRNFAKCIILKKPSILNENIGAEIMAILGAAYLSELRGRKAVSIEDFKEFCKEIERKVGREKASEEIIRELMKPYR